jgi:hypothetical protein
MKLALPTSKTSTFSLRINMVQVLGMPLGLFALLLAALSTKLYRTRGMTEQLRVICLITNTTLV